MPDHEKNVFFGLYYKLWMGYWLNPDLGESVPESW